MRAPEIHPLASPGRVHCCKTKLPVGYLGTPGLGVFIAMSRLPVKTDFTFFIGCLHFFFCDRPVFFPFLFWWVQTFPLVFTNALHLEESDPLFCVLQILFPSVSLAFLPCIF